MPPATRRLARATKLIKLYMQRRRAQNRRRIMLRQRITTECLHAQPIDLDSLSALSSASPPFESEPKTSSDSLVSDSPSNSSSSDSDESSSAIESASDHVHAEFGAVSETLSDYDSTGTNADDMSSD